MSAVKTIQIKVDKKRRNFERKDNERSILVEIKIFLVVVLLLLLLNIWTLVMVRSAAKKWGMLICSLLLAAAAFKWLFLPAWIRGI